MRLPTALLLTLLIGLTGCGESLEDRVARTFSECATEHGLEGGVVGITQGPEGWFELVLPDLPEPAATECQERISALLAE